MNEIVRAAEAREMLLDAAKGRFGKVAEPTHRGCEVFREMASRSKPS